MAIEQLLAQLGYTPAGTGPSEAENAAAALSQLVNTVQKKQQDDMDRKMKMFEMYKTLRSAGYTPQKAHEAALKPYGIAAPEGIDYETEKQGLELEEKRTNIKKNKAYTSWLEKGGKGNVKEEILRKKRAGEDLTEDEQEIYDTIISKKKDDVNEFDENPLLKADLKKTQIEKIKAETENIKAKTKGMTEDEFAETVNNDAQLRSQAIQILKDNKKPVTENNINYIIGSLGGSK